ALGAVKSNVGHLEGAAGIAGLMKAALALKHAAVPPQVHFRTLNPNIDLRGTPFVIPTSLRPWDNNDTPRAAAVSSFGFGGTNAHIVLEEAPASAEPVGSAKRVFVLPISARHPEALRSFLSVYENFLTSSTAISDVCYTASVRRSHHSYRC